MRALTSVVRTVTLGFVGVALCAACSSSSVGGATGTKDAGVSTGHEDSGTEAKDAGHRGDSGAKDSGTSVSRDGGSGGGKDSSAPAATWTFSGGTATAAFTSGTTPKTVTIPAGGDVDASLTLTFVPPSGSGSLTFSTAVDQCCGQPTLDVSPATLPADHASASNNPILYLSIDNPGGAAISFGSTPAITLSPTAGGTLATVISADIECQLDVYEAHAGASVWTAVAGASMSLSPDATSVSIPSGGSSLELPPGQSLVAISCD